MRRTLEDTILRTLWTIGVSTLFSRMALELIHDTLTHLTVPLIFWEMALPVVGVLVAELAPEKTEDFIQVRIARLPPPHSHPHWLGACSGLTSRDRHSSLLLKLRTFWTNDTPCPRRESMLTLRLVRSWQRRGGSSGTESGCDAKGHTGSAKTCLCGDRGDHSGIRVSCGT